MKRRGSSWGGVQASPFVQCEFCDCPAAFHWYATYPDLLLCLDCLALFPEAQGAPCEPSSGYFRQFRPAVEPRA
jgi:hypothetical protein